MRNFHLRSVCLPFKIQVFIYNRDRCFLCCNFFFSFCSLFSSLIKSSLLSDPVRKLSLRLTERIVRLLSAINWILFLTIFPDSFQTLVWLLPLIFQEALDSLVISELLLNRVISVIFEFTDFVTPISVCEKISAERET